MVVKRVFSKKITVEEVNIDGPVEPVTPQKPSTPKANTEEVRAALQAFYRTHDPSKVSTVENFVLWIDSNGVDAFNDLLFNKYGQYLPIGSCSVSSSSGYRNSIFVAEDEPEVDTRSILWSLWETFGTSKYAIVFSVIFVFGMFFYLYGHLATANLLIFGVGWTITSKHLQGQIEKRIFSSVLHVFWSLFGFFFLLESVFPQGLKMRFEYTLLKSVLFAYLYLPDRMFREHHLTDVVRVRLVTVMRDVILFVIEACLLLFFTKDDGQLRFREVGILILVAVVYLAATQQLKGRDMVVEEMFQTEEQYSGHLRNFKRAYVPTLSTVITSEEMEVMTRHIESISTLSELFCNELRIAVTKDMVGTAFQKFVPFLRMYAPFCADHEAKREMLTRLRERKPVVDALDATMKSGQNVQSLDSYLIMPVQRIPRYALLLTEVVKKTPKWHPDYEPCVNALAQVQEVARYVDEAIDARLNAKTSRSPTNANRNSSRLNVIGRTASSSSTASTSTAPGSS